MKVVACIKRVPDTASPIRISADNLNIEQQGIEFVMNPYDEYAVEEALRIKDKKPDTEVSVISIGPSETSFTIRQALAMGADKGIHIETEKYKIEEPYAIAFNLFNVINELQPDIVFFGKQAVDDDFAQVGIITAFLLNLPIVTNIIKFSLAGENSVEVVREAENSQEVLNVLLPAVFTAQKGLNQPRFATLKGIMQSKKKSIEKRNFIPVEGKLKFIKLEPPPKRPAGRILGEGIEAIPSLISALRNEAKLI